jgi:hypothetical protein
MAEPLPLELNIRLRLGPPPSIKYVMLRVRWCSGHAGRRGAMLIHRWPVLTVRLETNLGGDAAARNDLTLLGIFIPLFFVAVLWGLWVAYNELFLPLALFVILKLVGHRHPIHHEL